MQALVPEQPEPQSVSAVFGGEAHFASAPGTHQANFYGGGTSLLLLQLLQDAFQEIKLKERSCRVTDSSAHSQSNPITRQTQPIRPITIRSTSRTDVIAENRMPQRRHGRSPAFRCISSLTFAPSICRKWGPCVAVPAAVFSLFALRFTRVLLHLIACYFSRWIAAHL